MSTYEDKLADLRREIESKGARPAVIDTAVSELMSDRDKPLVRDLLLLLSDRAEHDEGMFSLIHAVKSFDDQEYVRTLLSAFPELVSSSPRWASIVLMRVLNSGSAQAEMIRQLRECPRAIKQSVREMCERINEVSPEFLSKTVPVTLAAS